MAANTITLVIVSYCLLLAQQLLLLAPSTTATSMPGGGTGTFTGETTVPLSAAVDNDDPPFFPGGPAAASRCWNAVLRAESCAGNILSSLLSLLLHDSARPEDGVRVGADCCGVLQAVGARCFRDLFTDSPFRPLYGPLVNHVCGFPASGGVVTPGRRE
ncbi:hypothetical protein ABZP36_027770 [Zizania latifolia]